MSLQKRSTNFSKSEEENLVKLVLQRKNIFENKKTDAVTSKQKFAAWEKVAQQFNTSSDNTFRTAKVLREKYRNIKRLIRKSKAGNRREQLVTDSGPPSAQSKEKSLYVELSDVMAVKLEDIPSRYESDDIASESDQTASADYNEEIVKHLEEYVQMSDNVNCAMDKEVTASPTNNWSEYHSALRHSTRSELKRNSKAQKRIKAAAEDILNLKKQLVEQQIEHARIEHEQKMMQSAEEHNIKMQILEAELVLKTQSQIKYEGTE